MNCETIIKALGTVATVAAVVVALLKKELRFWDRPVLKIRITPRPPDCQRSAVFHKQGCIEAFFLRLWVENTGRRRADQVQVFLARVLKNQGGDSFTEVRNFLPMNLKWAHTEKVFAEGISPKMGMHVTLGHLENPSQRKLLFPNDPIRDSNRTVLDLELEAKTAQGWHLLEPGDYKLVLRAAAANAGPTEKTISVSISGDWFETEDEMFTRGIKVIDPENPSTV
jgi:hypothetical protein